MASRLEVCIVGAGPRGLSVLERICANARRSAPSVTITVHVVDPYRAGPGQVWRTSQSHHLLMNTVAAQVTVFTDASVAMEGPLREGPSLHEWARLLTLMAAFESYDDQVLAQARDLRPDSYPTRAFYGRYLEWAFDRVVATAPGHVSVRAHTGRAVRLDDEPRGGRPCQAVVLDDGTKLGGLDAIVLAQGHLPAQRTEAESGLANFAESHGLTYIHPANPADVNLGPAGAGGAVALRGLGLSFFDYLALLTVGRGGFFEQRGSSLHYHPSGREPRIYAGSRRGVPYHARGDNQKGAYGRHDPAVLTPAAITALRRRATSGMTLDFGQDLWPLIAKEVETVYYTALLRSRARGGDSGRFRQRFLRCPGDGGDAARLFEEFGIEPGARWNWDRIARPDGGRTFSGPAEFRRWLLGYLRRDVALAHEGNVDGPLKSALDVLRDLRNEIRLLVDYGGLTPRSHRTDLERWYTPLNAFLSIGPPPRRVEEMIALIDAGVLDVLGPGMTVQADTGAPGFVVASAIVPDSAVTVTALVEARIPAQDVRRTADPLLSHLMATAQCRPFRVADPGGSYETGGLEVTGRPYHLVDACGRAHPRRFAYGVPTESVHWATAAGARPGVNSVTLADADAMARAVLALSGERKPGTGALHAVA
jgi:hypothetical protein